MITIVCRHCGTQKSGCGNASIYCSERCASRARYLKVNPRPPRACRHCANKIPAGAHANRDYCSSDCKKAVDSFVSKQQYPSRYKPRRFQKSCVVCGTTFIAKKRHGRYCSPRCADIQELRNPVARADRRRRRDRRQALCRGAERAYCFDAKQVLERDGWTCQICGVATPEHLRGTREPNAPELDHIIPLSRGGDHTPSNTQCLCYQCNRRKGAKLPQDFSVGRVEEAAA